MVEDVTWFRHDDFHRPSAGVGLKKMEMWQKQGFESFGAWRRETEKARRAAKKKSPAAASRPTRDAVLVPQQSAPPAAESSQRPTPASPQQFRGLREHVQVTPGGSRHHMLELTTPRGTRLATEYTSPPGEPSGQARRERLAAAALPTPRRLPPRGRSCLSAGTSGRD